MRNIVLELQYDGTNYNGWQVQASTSNTITIQGVLQKAIFNLTGENCKIIAAGRTDAGVHALSQIASFKTLSQLETKVIKRALNALLPDDIRILSAFEEDISFNPRYDAKSKIYSYYIANTEVISPFLVRYTWKIPHKLDIIAMIEASNMLVGKHDFTSFTASKCNSKNNIRTIISIKIDTMNKISFLGFSLEGKFIKVSVEADSFLRHMVRNIVGSIYEVGRGKKKKEDIEKILLLKDRKLAGQAAPAKGLFLEKVCY